MIDWLALAQEYYDLASDARKNGNYDAAKYWRNAGDAAREAARQMEQQHEPTDLDRSKIGVADSAG